MLYSYLGKVNVMTPPPMFQSAPSRICVIFPGALGDFLCFLPTLTSLAGRMPVDLFARTEFADFTPPSVRVYSSERHEITGLFVSEAVPAERLRDFFRGYAAVYSWTGGRHQEFIRSLQMAAQGRAHVFAFHPATPGTVHQADYYWSCLGEAGYGPAIPAVAPKPEMIAWCQDYWARHSLNGKAVLALAPGSGSRQKNWPATSYRAVAQWWMNQTHGTVIAIVGPVEEERGGLEPLLAHSVPALNLSLGQVAALLKQSTVYLGNDSGITHLAAAVGVRTVALFGPSAMRQWAPRGERVTVLSRNVECSPCDLPVMKSCPHRKCLTEFQAGTVITELRQLPELANLTRLGPGIRV